MLVAVTYDLNSGWDQVREAAFARGFFNLLNTNAGQKVAPNTTLFISNTSPASALVLFNQAVAAASSKLGRLITVERFFVARVEDWIMNSETPAKKTAA